MDVVVVNDGAECIACYAESTYIIEEYLIDPDTQEETLTDMFRECPCCGERWDFFDFSLE